MLGLNLLAPEKLRILFITISAVPVVLSLYYIVRRRLLLFLYVYLFSTVVILITDLFYPQNGFYLERGVFYMLLINMPSFLCIASINNMTVIKEVMLRLSYVVFLIGLVFSILVIFNKISFTSYSMSFSYYLLLPALMFAARSNIFHSIGFILTICLMLFLGSRGALVAAFTFVLFFSIISPKRRNLIFVIFAAAAVSILLIDMNTILDQSKQFFGFSSRSLTFLLEGTFASDGGRDPIYKEVWASVINGPFLGYGIFGDRVILEGVYSHNIYLEIVSNFGLALGGIISIWLTWIIADSYNKSNKANKEILVLFFCLCFFPLLISGSYLTNNWFGLFMGAIFLIRRYNSIISNYRTKNLVLKLYHENDQNKSSHLSTSP